jgi:hypothetical protein
MAAQGRSLDARVRFEGAGQIGGPARDHHRDSPAKIDAGEIVMAGLGQMQAVADEYQRRVDPPGRRPAGDPEEDVSGHAERRRVAVRHQSRARARREDRALLERHPLEPAAILPRRREPRLGEAARDMVGSAAMAFAARLAAFHVVRRQRLYITPPGGGAVRSGRGGEQQRGKRQQCKTHCHTRSSRRSGRFR